MTPTLAKTMYPTLTFLEIFIKKSILLKFDLREFLVLNIDFSPYNTFGYCSMVFQSEKIKNRPRIDTLKIGKNGPKIKKISIQKKL